MTTLTNNLTSTTEQLPQMKRTYKKLSEKQSKILKEWFLNHAKDPYPDYQAKELLMKETGASKAQIEKFFENARQKQRKGWVITLEPKKRLTLTTLQQKLLREWFFNNRPYPNREEKQQLASDVGITLLQLENYFVLLRRYEHLIEKKKIHRRTTTSTTTTTTTITERPMHPHHYHNRIAIEKQQIVPPKLRISISELINPIESISDLITAAQTINNRIINNNEEKNLLYYKYM